MFAGFAIAILGLSFYTRIASFIFFVLGLARLAGSNKENWKSRENAVGVLLMAAAVFGHAIFVTGADMFSPVVEASWVTGASTDNAICVNQYRAVVEDSRDNPFPSVFWNGLYRFKARITVWDWRLQEAWILPAESWDGTKTDTWVRLGLMDNPDLGKKYVGVRWRRQEAKALTYLELFLAVTLTLVSSWLFFLTRNEQQISSYQGLFTGN